MELTYILVFSTISSIGALIGAGAILLYRHVYEKNKMLFLSYAVGALMGVAFLGVLPEAMTLAPPPRILSGVLLGFLFFWAVEKIARLPETLSDNNAAKSFFSEMKPAAIVVLVGDALHNFVDGVLIASAFSFSISLGILTSVATLAHEIPNELGDFVVLLESRMGRWRAYWLNFLCSLTTVVGALLTYWFRSYLVAWTPDILAIAGASFLYISAVHLIPALHEENSMRASIKQTAGLLIGASTVLLLRQLLG